MEKKNLTPQRRKGNLTQTHTERAKKDSTNSNRSNNSNSNQVIFLIVVNRFDLRKKVIKEGGGRSPHETNLQLGIYTGNQVLLLLRVVVIVVVVVVVTPCKTL